MGKASIYNCRVVVGCILLAGLLLAGPAVSWAADTVCARVKIEIKQELTLERQGFDAHMRINNGLASISLENVNVDVSFADKDGNPVLASSDSENTDALFFIRLDSKENIDDVSGSGTVNPSTSADIHWLIIPSPGSSNGLESGTLYYVGAELTYTIGGEEKVTEVTPDYIFVKPMPEITLDYFLPSDVYGDDPLTEDTVEPIVPFSLGVRVKNSGHGVARKLKIESAQPKITENKQGLLIGFAIEGSEVNGQPASDSLLVDFGDIAANSSAMARWIMTCTLSGKFVSFTADFSHSDELGGELTSLIQAVNTHFLVHDVIVDLPGRDTIPDFLARDGSVYRIYESEVTGLGAPEDQDPEVTDQSSTAVLSGTGDTTRTLTTDVTAGFMYVRVTDPFDGDQVLKEVVRSDGKIIKSANAWLSHTREGANPWQYHLNLFDVNSTGIYTLKFETTSAVPLPPTLQYITDKTVLEGEQVSFIVEASDPNDTVPQLSAAPLPVGAVFIDDSQGEGAFDWTPGTGQAGVYGIVFKASDGVLEASRRATITVQSFRDTDGDGLDDDWEMQHFGTLARDGSGDFDRDGISDLDEFENGTDPAALADVVIRQTADKMNPVVGDTVILTITATSNGPRSATGVQVNDLLSAGLAYIRDDSGDDSGGSYDHETGIWDLTALEPNTTATLNITAEVTRSGKILNIAALSDTDLYDPKQSNNSAALILNGGIQSDLALALTSDNLTPEDGDTITVALTVTNNGTDDATGVEIEDLLPGDLSYVSSTVSQGDYYPDTGIWDVGDLASGAGAELLLTLTSNSIDEMVLTAVLAAGDQPDPDPTNNRSSIVINQHPVDHPYIADLAIHKLVNHSAVDVGGQAVFTLLVRNNGPDDAGNIKINDLLPVGLNLQSAIPSQGNYDNAGEPWQVGTIPAGALAVMDMIVDVTEAGDQDNTADIVHLDEFDPDGGNDFDTRSVTVTNVAPVVTAGADQTADEGQTVNFDAGFEDPGADTHQISWDFGDGTTAEGTLSPSHAYADNGSYTVSVTVTDDEGAADTGMLIVTVINAAPAVEAGENRETAEGVSISFSGGFTDPGADTHTIEWDFGDGEVDAGKLDPTHSYADNGQYIVTLTVKDDDGAEVSDTLTVTVNNAAPAVTAGSDLVANEGDLVSFNGSFSDASPSDTHTFTWYFGDGTPANTASLTPDHSYADDGVYTVTLTVTDDDGGVGIDTLTVTVANANPTVAAGDDKSAAEGADVNFGGSFNDASPSDTHTYAWNFGDESAEITDSLTPDHSYADDGVYTVTLTVTDDDGGVGTDTLTVTVANANPTVAAGDDKSAAEGADVNFGGSFNDASPSDTHTYAWNFGDESAEITDSLTPSHSYADDGVYTVTLTVTDDDGGVGIDTLTVTVANANPTVAAGDDKSAAEGADVNFGGSFNDASPSDTHTYVWNFGDESAEITDSLTPSHSYADDGVYTVTLTVTDDDGGVGTDTLTVTVANANPTVAAGDDKSAAEGADVNFGGSFNDASPSDTHTYVWNFGDVSAEITDSLTPSHSYADDGVYTVTLTVTDDDGGVGIDTLTVTVANANPTVAAGDDVSAAEGADVNFGGSFNDASPSDTHTYVWNFGDESAEITDSLTPSHSYADDGVYTVTLTVTDDDGGVGIDTLTVTVANANPTVAAGDDKSAAEGADVNFGGSFNDASPSDTHTYAWNFGDESAEITDSLTPSHSYADDGVYTVTLTVTDDDGGVGTDTLLVIVDNVAPTADAGSDGTINEGGTFSSTGSFTDPGADTWTATVDYGDGPGAQALDLDADKSFALSHLYTENGSYTVTVTVSDDEGAASSAIATVTVNNVAPTADAGSDGTINEGGTFSSTGSFTDPGADTWTATVDYGDGSGAQLLALNPEKTFTLSHTYIENDTYTVTVTISDGDGDSGSDTASVTVNNVAPTADAGSDGTINEGGTFSSTGSFTDPGADTWTATVDYGDGSGVQALVLNEDKSFALSHLYTENGRYTVTVTASDDEGAAGSDTASVTVNNVAPTADAGSDATINEGGTFSSTGSFTDPGADEWTATVDYGDGSGAQALVLNPEKTFTLSHTYIENDTYTVTVTISDGDGDSGSDTASVTVNNVAPTADAGSDGTINEGGTFSSTGSFTDPGADTWTATVDYGDGSGVQALVLNEDKSFALSHIYAENGSYTVTVTVSDDEGAAGSDAATVTVNNVAPTADAGSDGTINEGGTFSSTGSFTDPGADTWTATVDYGDGPGAQALDLDADKSFTLSHLYTGNGSYTVTVTVSDDEGAASSAIATVTVNNVAPTADAGSDGTINEGGTFSSTGSFTDPGADTWTAIVDYGDGPGAQALDLDADKSFTLSHLYTENGSYTVTVTVTDDEGAAGSATANVTVNNVAPTADAGSDGTINEGDTFSSTGSFTDPGADEWTATVDYGDRPGAQALVLNEDKSFALSHIYAENGTYTVTVTVSDDEGAAGSATATVTVNNVAPTVEAGLNAAINEGGTFTSSGSFTDPGADEWTATVDYGDGSGAQALVLNEDKSFALSHIYAENGTYTVTVTVSDDEGAAGSAAATVTVNNVAPIANAGDDRIVDEGATVSFAGSFTDPGADSHTIQWNFGDGNTASGDLSVNHAYADNGTYDVTLTVTDDEYGVGAHTLTVTVNNVAPSADAGSDGTINEGGTFSSTGSFTDPGVDTWTATVDYGDGSGDQPLAFNQDKSFVLSQMYAENGTYTVTVTISDDDGDSGSDTVIVTVNNVPPAANAGDDQAVNEGDLVFFTGGFTDPGADTHTIEWEFGDGASATDTLTPAHSYGDNGTYTVTVTVTDDDGGTGTDTLTVEVANVAPVITDLTNDNPSTGEVHMTAFFADPGWLDSHSSHWDFGDGAATDIFNAEKNENFPATGSLTAVHTYSEEGLFTVSVTVKDDDGADSTSKTIDVLIDKTAPVITVFEPQAGYYRNTEEIKVDVTVADPVSGGVSSGLVAASVFVSLDGQEIKPDELLDLSELADGIHTLHVSASDYAGNSAEQEVSFEVGPVPALVHIQPHNWDLNWLDPFDNPDDFDSKKTVKAEISLENAEVETIIPTDNAARLKAGNGYGDFVVVDVVADQISGKRDKGNVVSLTLEYVGIDEMDILVFSGDTVQDFYSVNAGDTIAIVSGQAGYLDRHTVLSSYQSDPPLLSAADIIPETVLLNQWVPIIEGSARLITKDAADLAQSGVIAEPPYGVVKEKKHHVWLANVGQPQQMTLEVGNQTIFADEPYPVNWQDWFSLDDDGRLQMMRIHVSEKDNLLKVLHHNLQAEARIYLDGDLALTILPETNLIAMEVLFNRFDVMSTIDREILQRGGNWLVTAHNGATLKGKHPRKHISVSDIGHPQKAKLVIGDTVVFDDQPFPINWSERYLIVDGQRQDLSIKTKGARGNSPHLSINCKELTHEARLYLDDTFVLLILPPPEVAVSITGELELDGDPATFDGSFRGSDAIELKGKLPKDFDPPMSYQRINTSGEPALQISNRNGDFEVVDFTEEYKDYRVKDLSLRYDGEVGTEINVYEDSRRKHLIDRYPVSPGDYFVLDVSHLDSNKVYLEIGKKRDAIDLTGRKAAEIGDRFLNCTVMDISWIPIGPPHYIDLTLEYVGALDAIALTAYDGKRKNVVGTYPVDSYINPVFTIDGSQRPKGHMGENLVLEYGSD